MDEKKNYSACLINDGKGGDGRNATKNVQKGSK